VDILLVEVREFFAIRRATEKIGRANLLLLEGVVKRDGILRRQKTEAEAQSSNPNPTSACSIVPAHWLALLHFHIVHHCWYSIHTAKMRAPRGGCPNHQVRCQMKTFEVKDNNGTAQKWKKCRIFTSTSCSPPERANSRAQHPKRSLRRSVIWPLRRIPAANQCRPKN
jgi:hypothetical protein